MKIRYVLLIAISVSVFVGCAGAPKVISRTPSATGYTYAQEPDKTIVANEGPQDKEQRRVLQQMKFNHERNLVSMEYSKNEILARAAQNRELASNNVVVASAQPSVQQASTPVQNSGPVTDPTYWQRNAAASPVVVQTSPQPSPTVVVVEQPAPFITGYVNFGGYGPYPRFGGYSYRYPGSVYYGGSYYRSSYTRSVVVRVSVHKHSSRCRPGCRL